jgi:hypothetical protein
MPGRLRGSNELSVSGNPEQLLDSPQDAASLLVLLAAHSVPIPRVPESDTHL